MRMKKVIEIILILTINMLILTSCDGRNDGADAKKYTVCCTIFPGYDWASACLGDADDVELVYLLEDGEDMHSYQPSVTDIAKITEADMFIYVGGPSDEWVVELLDSSGNPNQIRVCMMDVLSEALKEEEIVEGMTSKEGGHSREIEAGDADESDEEIEYDEHVWLSFDNAELIVKAIGVAFGEMDEKHADRYMSNADEYSMKLRAMKENYESKLQSRTHDTIIVADRFPFRYMVDEFDVKYYAAFPGCSAESESSFETIVFLIEKSEELGIHNIYIIENADAKLANTICENGTGDIEVLELDSMQSVTAEDIIDGASYINYMTENMEALLRGLL